MNDHNFVTVSLALLLALAAMPARSAPPPDAARDIKTVVAKVGERPITREDIIHMILIEKYYKSPPLSEADALFDVMQDAIAQEVANSVGINVTPSETPLNSPFVNQYTPRGKEDIKEQAVLPPHEQAFHVDQLSYAQLYVVPKMIDRKLRRYYNTSSYLHRNERERINHALQLAISGKSFADAANETGLVTVRHELKNKDTGISAAQIPDMPVDRHLPKKGSVFDILDKLAPGEIHTDILQDEDGYRVLRLIARNGQRYSIETIEAPKQQFEDWLRERAGKLNIEVSDDTLKREVKRHYPGIDWVERL